MTQTHPGSVSQATTTHRPEAPANPPALFIGGPWHTRVEPIPHGWQDYRVATFAEHPLDVNGTVVYHAHRFHLGGGNLIRVFTPYYTVTVDQVFTALVEIAGLVPPGTTPGGEQ